MARGRSNTRDKVWGETILTGLLDKAAPGKVIIVGDNSVRVDRTGESHYDKRQAGEGEGQPDK